MDGHDARRALGVPDDASAHDVRAAFRRLARLHHPDAGGDPRAFRRIATARDVLLAPAPSGRPARDGGPARQVAAAALHPRPHVDCYDAPPRSRPRRDFADVLRAAVAAAA